MAIWYEGNLNKSENRHEENGAVVVMRVDDTEKAAALLAETA